jgi:hypothetical protein
MILISVVWWQIVHQVESPGHESPWLRTNNCAPVRKPYLESTQRSPVRLGVKLLHANLQIEPGSRNAVTLDRTLNTSYIVDY